MVVLPSVFISLERNWNLFWVYWYKTNFFYCLRCAKIICESKLFLKFHYNMEKMKLKIEKCMTFSSHCPLSSIFCVDRDCKLLVFKALTKQIWLLFNVYTWYSCCVNLKLIFRQKSQIDSWKKINKSTRRISYRWKMRTGHRPRLLGIFPYLNVLAIILLCYKVDF